MAKILVIPDLHIPATHPQFLRFCKDMQKAWSCDTVIFLGDIFDLHRYSFWDHHPDMPSQKDELELAQKKLKPWIRAFPTAFILHSNHDQRIFRKAVKAGIPETLLKGYNELFAAPETWVWSKTVDMDDVHFVHGSGRGGLYPAANKSRYEGRSICMGHIHSAASIVWSFSKKHRFFGMSCGSGVDDNHPAFRYSEECDKKSAIACGVIIDGHPYLEIMPCGKDEKYHKRG